MFFDGDQAHGHLAYGLRVTIKSAAGFPDTARRLDDDPISQ
jgi:hypothetical protein